MACVAFEPASDVLFAGMQVVAEVVKQVAHGYPHPVSSA